MQLSKLSLSVLLICVTAGQLQADERVIWECRTSNPYANPILHLVESGDRSYVKFANMRFGAHFQSEEDQLGWYWHNDGSGYYRYAIILGADGKAWYHQFDTNGVEDSQPLDYFVCQADS